MGAPWPHRLMVPTESSQQEASTESCAGEGRRGAAQCRALPRSKTREEQPPPRTGGLSLLPSRSPRRRAGQQSWAEAPGRPAAPRGGAPAFRLYPGAPPAARSPPGRHRRGLGPGSPLQPELQLARPQPPAVLLRGGPGGGGGPVCPTSCSGPGPCSLTTRLRRMGRQGAALTGSRGCSEARRRSQAKLHAPRSATAFLGGHHSLQLQGRSEGFSRTQSLPLLRVPSPPASHGLLLVAP